MSILTEERARNQAPHRYTANSGTERADHTLERNRDAQITAAYRDLSAAMTSTGQQRYAALLLWLLRSREAGPVRALRLDLQASSNS